MILYLILWWILGLIGSGLGIWYDYKYVNEHYSLGDCLHTFFLSFGGLIVLLMCISYILKHSGILNKRIF